MVGLGLVPHDAHPIDERPGRLRVLSLLDQDLDRVYPLEPVACAGNLHLAGLFIFDDLLTAWHGRVDVAEVKIFLVAEYLYQTGLRVRLLLVLNRVRWPVEADENARDVHPLLEKYLEEQLCVNIGCQSLVRWVGFQHLHERRVTGAAIQNRRASLVNKVGADHEVVVLMLHAVGGNPGLGELVLPHLVGVRGLIADALHDHQESAK
mmetsp:Transcript_50319/g.113052  ORF Transcript_50319/g.113052 Transcript_50319/m.113052 type:complete len:207 (+) Transcript_50319:144-764(+)